MLRCWGLFQVTLFCPVLTEQSKLRLECSPDPVAARPLVAVAAGAVHKSRYHHQGSRSCPPEQAPASSGSRGCPMYETLAAAAAGAVHCKRHQCQPNVCEPAGAQAGRKDLSSQRLSEAFMCKKEFSIYFISHCLSNFYRF
jgi:hypothetical protein